MTPEEADVLRHSLGLDRRTRRSYRNHFAADAGSADYQICRQLAAAGLMKGGRIINETYPLHVFHVTEAGAAAIGAKLPT